MPGLPREVVEWLRGLNLSSPVRNPTRDLANGYVVAEILNKYYPGGFPMLKFSQKSSSFKKKYNWETIERLGSKVDMKLPVRLIEATANQCHDGAQLLLVHLYETLNRTAVRVPNPPFNPNCNDLSQQPALINYQRDTVSSSIKNTFKMTKVMLRPPRTTEEDAIRFIVELFKDQKRGFKLENPNWYGHKPTLRERAPRRAVMTFKERAFASTTESSNKDTNPPSGTPSEIFYSARLSSASAVGIQKKNSVQPIR